MQTGPYIGAGNQFASFVQSTSKLFVTSESQETWARHWYNTAYTRIHICTIHISFGSRGRKHFVVNGQELVIFHFWFRLSVDGD